ncbi:hypothetical protein [Marinomonas sp. THO17]|uniref:hypothetical protein n=1 Tax=Marinomonas sp. THO17 TaxID=3149048 RepID=UPI00336C101C
MKIKIAAVIVFLLSGCASLQSPRETNIAVSTLLDEIQIAINEIDARTGDGSGLPPFKNAEVKLTTKAKISSEGSASLILSGEKSKTSTDSNVLTLELVPNPATAELLSKGTGHEIAEYVIAAVTAVDEKGFLKLNSLTVEAGLEVVQAAGGNIEVELIGITVKGGRKGESTESNNLKLVFAYPAEKESK